MSIYDGFSSDIAGQTHQFTEELACKKSGYAHDFSVLGRHNRSILSLECLDQGRKGLAVHQRLIAKSKNDRRNFWFDLNEPFQAASDRGADPVFPQVVNYYLDRQIMNFVARSLGISSEHDTNRSKSARYGGFSCRTDETPFLKIEKLIWGTVESSADGGQYDEPVP